MKKKSNNNKRYFDDFNGDETYAAPKKWYEQFQEDPNEFEPVSEQILIELKEEAEKCHNADVANYNIKNAKTNSNYKWMKTVMSKGTVSDKIAAHTIAIQDDAVCNLETLQNMVKMVKVGKKKECTAVMDVLTELFLSDLLRPDRKLKPFHQRPLSQLNDLASGNALTRKKLLSCWYFEDKLKQTYNEFVLALNNIAHDTVDNNKEKAISCMFKLLAGNPEQEKNLLANLVNKLGDPSQKVASKAIYCLGQLLQKHSNMQEVVLNEVEKLLFRPNVSTKAQYYGLCFLSQYCLSHEASNVARRLVEVYFSFFKACVKKGDVDTRMMTALLMGVNRAFPYAKLEMEKISDHIDTMYRIVHIANFNIGLHALTLLYQVCDSNDKISDRFYSALYKKLGDAKLFNTTYQAMLLNLIYKAILKDGQEVRVKTFIKRLLQLALYMQPAFACGILFLISQIFSKKNNIQSNILNAVSSMDDPENDVKVRKYDPLSRNPLYSNIDCTCYLELNYLRQHFHPTIALYANNILQGILIKYSGDPLKDFTLIRFLDRFVFKNPKKEDKHGMSTTMGKRKIYQAKGIKSLPITSENYLNQKEEKIPVDERFMYNYLKKKFEERPKKKDDDDESDLESVQSDEFEEMLDKMAGKKNGDDDEEDDDLDFMAEVGDSMKNQTKKTKKKLDDDGEGDEDEDLDLGDDEDEDEDLESLDEDDDINELDEDELEVDEDGEDEDLNINEDEEDGSELDDEEGNFELDDEDKQLIQGLYDEEDAEDLVFDDDDDEDDEDEDNKKSNKKGKNKSDKKKKKGGIESLFASAEEFASLLEEEGSSKVKPGSSNALSNADRANVKQLEWEQKRNHWIRGFNKATNKRPKPNKNFKPNKRRKMKK